MNNTQKGFTLLELLIALTLMGVISITSTQILRSTTTDTKKITQGMDNLSRLRSVFNIIKNDTLKAFNYRDLNIFLYNEAQKERAKRYDDRIQNWVNSYNEKNKPSPPLTPSSLNSDQTDDMEKEIGKRPEKIEEKKEIIVTNFKGDREKFYFTSASGIRFRSQDKVSTLIETGYFLKTCKGKRYKKRESKCLWRSISYNLDEDVTKGGTASVLLENIHKFELSYLVPRQRDEPEWVKSWDSNDETDLSKEFPFPAAVKLKLTVKFPVSKNSEKFKKVTLQGVFKIEFPNNSPFKDLLPNTESNETNLEPASEEIENENEEGVN